MIIINVAIIAAHSLHPLHRFSRIRSDREFNFQGVLEIPLPEGHARSVVSISYEAARPRSNCTEPLVQPLSWSTACRPHMAAREVPNLHFNVVGMFQHRDVHYTQGTKIRILEEPSC